MGREPDVEQRHSRVVHEVSIGVPQTHHRLVAFQDRLVLARTETKLEMTGSAKGHKQVELKGDW